MALRINNALRVNIVDTGVVGALGTSAILKVYDGTQPGTAGDATTANLLVEISGLSWNAATNGTAAIASTKTGTAGTTGTATWARLAGTDGSTYIIDGNCGTASTHDFILDNSIIAGLSEVTLITASIIQPSE
jgi:hypothetical protein